MPDFDLTNRYSRSYKIRVTDPPDNAGDLNGCVIMLHGFAGSMDQELMLFYERSFRQAGLVTVTIDAPNSLNSAEGTPKDMTMQEHADTLADTVLWVHKQDSLRKPVLLFGHSMGGYAVLTCAASHSGYVAGVIASAPVTSGMNFFSAWKSNLPGSMQHWQETGFLQEIAEIDTQLYEDVPITIWQEWMEHTLFDKAPDIMPPALILAGEKDPVCPPGHINRLVRLMPEQTTYTIIPNADHDFESEQSREQVSEALVSWLDTHDTQKLETLA